MIQRVFITLVLLAAGPNAWSDHCASEASVFGPHQIVTKGMLDMMGQGVFDRAVIEEFGEQQKIAQAHSERGEYHQACSVLEALIAKYEIKSFEESYYEAYPEKRPGNAPKASAPAAESSASAEGAMEADSAR